jgi:hypothetical protein
MHLLGPAIVKKETYLGSNPGHTPEEIGMQFAIKHTVFFEKQVAQYPSLYWYLVIFVVGKKHGGKFLVIFIIE